MFSPAVEKQRHQLYATAIEGMEEQLENVTDTASMFKAVRWGLDLIEQTHDETPAKIRRTVACHAGCSHCCSTLVDLQAHEVFYVAEHIQLNFSPDRLAALIEHLAAHRERYERLGPDAARERPWSKCALLGPDGKCTIYVDRPEICRVHHTSDSKPCEALNTDPTADIDGVHVVTLRARMFAVMLGLDEAIESFGYDNRSYDFNAALHEALTNSLSRVLWMRLLPAFPDGCLSEPMESSA